jgi:hypothetical protein
MIRSVFVGLAAFVAITAVSAQGCKASGVGDPCIPEKEFDPSFTGFDPGEVNVESKSFQCLTRLCLVNHFRGRVTCPYGQNKDATGLPTIDGASGGSFGSQDSFQQTIGPCLIPGGTDPTKDGITGKDTNGNYVDPTNEATVPPQCLDREAVNTVYCSCRCANADGKTDDGANYCTCPDGFACNQLVAPVGLGDVGLTGAYCIKKNTTYDPSSSCLGACDPTLPDHSQDCAPPAIR